jgi:hypothetical protein
MYVRFMTERQALRTDPASLTPGPHLAALLDELDLAAVPDEQLIPVLQASLRQLNHTHAIYLAALVEVGRREPPPAGPAWQASDSWQWATDQISAALTYTARRTDHHYQLAHHLLDALPQVWRALHTGRIDLPKAAVFADYLSDLTPAQRDRICTRLLPPAPGWTTGQLAHRLLREVLAIDPRYTRRRYQKAIRDRGVWGYLAPDGTAVLSAHGLTPGEAAAAAERLEDLAAATRRAGHPATEDQLRADLLVRLLDGRYTGLTRDQIITALLTDPATQPDQTDPTGDPGTAAGADPAAGTGSAGDAHSAADAHAAAADPTDTAAGAEPTGTPPDADPTGTPPDADPTGTPPDAAGTATGDHTPGRVDVVDDADPSAAAPPAGSTDPSTDPSTDSEPAAGEPATDTTPAGMADPPGAKRPQSEPGQGPQYGIEVRVGLATLLGLDDHPAELPGWGPINADEARRIVAHHHTAEWRFAVLDDHGHLSYGGLTRYRPPLTPHHPPPPAARSGMVELHIRAALLHDLARCPDLPAGWARLVTDLADQHTQRRAQLKGVDNRPHARYPHAGLRRHVQIRDRTCVAPGCRRPARKTDQDHTLDHVHGGPTVRGNLEPLCTRHHRMKHRRGWTLTQPEPGHFTWRSPLGQTYPTRGEPIRPDLPEPLPNPDPDPDLEDYTDRPRSEGPIFHPYQWRKLRPPEPEPAPPPPEPDDTPPPF